MRIVLITPATFDPLELADLKDRPELHIDTTDYDSVLPDLLQSAVEAYEEFTGNVLCLSVWDQHLDEFPEKRIETPAPLSLLTNDSPPTAVPVITYLDASRNSQTLATTVYKVDQSSQVAGRIVLRSAQVWPTTCDEANAVVIRLAAGYASAAAIPQRIKDGLVAKVQELYDGIDRSFVYENCWRKYRRIPVI